MTLPFISHGSGRGFFTMESGGPTRKTTDGQSVHLISGAPALWPGADISQRRQQPPGVDF